MNKCLGGGAHMQITATSLRASCQSQLQKLVG